MLSLIVARSYHTTCVGLRKIPFGCKTEKDRETRDKYIKKHFGDWFYYLLHMNTAFIQCLSIYLCIYVCYCRRCPQCCSLASNLATSAQQGVGGGNLTHSLSSAHLSLNLSAVRLIAIIHTLLPYIRIITYFHC